MSSILVVAALFASDWYRLPCIRRLDQNVYGNANVVVVTRYCYEHVHCEDAVLKWNGPGYMGSAIYFENGSECEVEKVVPR